MRPHATSHYRLCREFLLLLIASYISRRYVFSCVKQWKCNVKLIILKNKNKDTVAFQEIALPSVTAAEETGENHEN
jgi:hypothetical protein